MKGRYLTKSRFNLASGCPAKLFYIDKPEYANHNTEDPFLQALAEGGFQVGELAKCYFPDGTDLSAADDADALIRTDELLKNAKAVIYEAAFVFGPLFIRTDILVKNGPEIELIEVKAKSFDSAYDSFTGRRGDILSGWMPYIRDIAFQKYVLRKALPKFGVKVSLMLADKNAVCKTDGLNQKFLIVRGPDAQISVRISPDLSEEDLTDRILVKISADRECEILYGTDFGDGSIPVSYGDLINMYAHAYKNDVKINAAISANCRSCEFYADEEEKKNGSISGFEECWKNALGWCDDDFKEPNILEIWNYRKKNELIEAGRVKLTDVRIDDIKPESDGKPGMSASERQWLQIKKAREHDDSPLIDRIHLAAEMKKWTYPLHFIDFETTMAAIPFNKGRHPYEGIAFQFSHHIVHESGTVEHAGQYLNTERGRFPNYDFLRNLKNSWRTIPGAFSAMPPMKIRF